MVNQKALKKLFSLKACNAYSEQVGIRVGVSTDIQDNDKSGFTEALVSIGISRSKLGLSGRNNESLS